MRQFLFVVFFCLCVSQMTVHAQQRALPLLKVSENKRFLMTEDGKPFFWLGDTGWLLLLKLNREEVIEYLDNRKQKGFNVIQVMVLHDVKKAINIYGDSALVQNDASRPKTTPGNRFDDPVQYDFWDHADYVLEEAAKRGIYLALVPIWGSNVKDGMVNQAQAKKFAEFLADRYKNKTNIIWLNGGDIKGDEHKEVWETVGSTLRANDPHHLISFHPRGRSTSSQWFHQAAWLDFNMFQSGHKDYAQDTVEPRMGEDNWKYLQNDLSLKPAKPSFDGEPSYENIPHGLHDTLGPKWNAADIRRYAYWDAFAGGCGFTYGHNAVMQFHNAVGAGSYGSHQHWKDAINDPAAGQMQYLKKLILSKPYFSRIPDQTLIASGQGEKYNYLIATRADNYAMIYSFTGRNMNIQFGKIKGKQIKASWYDPRNGSSTAIGSFNNAGHHVFDPPGDEKNGNDWVLVLETVTAK